MSASRVLASEQYCLVMECRQSGFSDYQWCLERKHKIILRLLSIILQLFDLSLIISLKVSKIHLYWLSL